MLSYRRVLPRLVAELRDALDTCAERQRQLEQSLRVSRRLLRAWYAGPGTPTRPSPGPQNPAQRPGQEGGPSAHFPGPVVGVIPLPPCPEGSEKPGLLLPVSSQGTS